MNTLFLIGPGGVGKSTVGALLAQAMSYLEDCEVPELLKTKRYADFRKDFNKGLLELITSLKRLVENNFGGDHRSRI